MEILLNLLWLAIAFAIGAVFLPRHRGRIAAVVAVACLIALLFPIVSISDDLSPARDALEECSAVRRIAAAAHGSQPSPIHHPATPAVLATPLASAVVVVAIASEDTLVEFTSLILAARTNPRSPPSH